MHSLSKPKEMSFPATKSVQIPRSPGFNFGGGPGAVREQVREQAAYELLHGGLLDMSHREEKGPVHEFLNSYQALVRKLLKVPSDYHVLIMQGGAHAQFSGIPFNLASEHKRCLALVTGFWSNRAATEHAKFLQVDMVKPDPLTTEQDTFQQVSERLKQRDYDYVYLCTNETMHGVQLFQDELLPTSSVVVSDSTSDLFCRPIDVSKYGVIFASGGKNVGPAGMTLVLVRDSILKEIERSMQVPSFLDWREYAFSSPIPNLFNTPPLVSIGLSKLFLEDLDRRGGVEYAAERNAYYAQAIYDTIESSGGFYKSLAPHEMRSKVSIPFRISNNSALEAKFIKQAEEQHGLSQLINHPSMGGMRASLYNGMSSQGLETLLSFMTTFRLEMSK